MIFKKSIEIVILISTILCCSNALKCLSGTYYKDIRNNRVLGRCAVVECSSSTTDVCVRNEMKVDDNFLIYDYTCEDFIEPLEDIRPYHDIVDDCYYVSSTSDTVQYYEQIMAKNSELRNYFYIKNVGEYGIRMKVCPCNNRNECNYKFLDVPVTPLIPDWLKKLLPVG